ncbi:MAG: hypothetical protein DRP82_02355 [Planctomycetota bacterium]|nr:MAG: hypothetical protein DRP82_02355 [Planctomycetota bacterium]
MCLRKLAIAVVLCAGCATSGMRNGVGQAAYEVRQAMTSEEPEKTMRLRRATTVLEAWQRAYGAPDRNIDDTSFYPVLEQMERESTLWAGIKGLVSQALGNTWWEKLLAALAPVLGGLGIWQMRKARRHSREKSILIEEIEKAGNGELKARIAKRIAQDTPFGREVKKHT